MAKREPNVQAVLEATNEILASNNGRMPYNDWKAAVEAKLGTATRAFIQINKHKLVKYWYEGMDENGVPKLFVVSELPQG